MKHIKQTFALTPGHDPGVVLGVQGVKNLFFSNMVMWHIKLTEMKSRKECK